MNIFCYNHFSTFKFMHEMVWSRFVWFKSPVRGSVNTAMNFQVACEAEY